MEEKVRAVLDRTARVAVLTLAVALLFGAGSAWADIKFLGDGAKQNPTNNGWDLPTQGSCLEDTNQKTRPDCLALRLTGTYGTKALCEALVSGVQQRSWSTGVCNDTLPAHAASQAACEAVPDRKWSNGVCAIVLKGDDRNAVECMVHNGTWVTAGTCTGNWIMPLRTDYTPNVLTANGSNGTGAGAGDQCLRCHNTVTQYNSTRVRDTEDTLYMGHKNMARPVVPNQPWGGPPLHCVNGSNVEQPSYTAEEPCLQAGFKWVPKLRYPSDDGGNPFNWTAGSVNVGGSCSNPTYPTQALCEGATPPGVWTPGTDRFLTWIYGDWLASLPRAIYKAPASSTTVCTDPRGNASNCASFYGGTMVNNAGASYSCGRCHTTGWTSDASINTLKEPEATFGTISFPRLANALADMVNLSGGVANDPNKTSSWDVWGISCTRCHSAAVDTTTGGGVPPFTAAAGTSSHHSNLTAPDFPGWCSLTTCGGSRCSSTNCVPSGGIWYNGYCTDPRFLGTAPSAAAAMKTACETHTVGGVNLGPAAPGSPNGTWVTPCSDNNAATAVDCTAVSGTWNLPTSTCSVAGACNDPAMTTAGTCTGTVATGPLTGLVRQWQATSNIVDCIDAAGKWTGSLAQRGQIITSLCMNCHRQETSGYPNTNGSCAGWSAILSASAPTTQGACVAAQGTWTDSGNGIGLTVGPYHSTVTFPSHPAGNQFLNSPHGKFTGTYAQIATGQFKYNGTGEYKSFFINDGEAGNTGNGCTGCHEIHTSTVSGEKPFREECTACHTKSLNLINHPKGTGTPMPFEILGTPEEFEACVACHMPEGVHLFRINVNAGYSTFPMPAAMKANTSPNTSPDGTFTNAVWNDLDHACGKCHGGGASQATTTGGRIDLKFSDAGVAGAVSCASVGGTWASSKCTDTVNNTSTLCANVGGTWSSGACTLTAGKYLQVANTAGFLANEKIRVPNAGSLSYDGEPAPILHKGDFDSYIFAIKTAGAPGILTLAGAPSYPVSGKTVVQNATTNGGAWISKVALAGYAKGIHNDKPFASFTSVYGANGATVVVDASASKCSGSAANCNAYDWDWGDGTIHGSGVTASHVYTTFPPLGFTITLTVAQYSVGDGVATQKFKAYPVINRPVADGTCTIDYTAWTATCTNTSVTPDAGYQQLVFDWGDGTVLSTVMSAPWNAPVGHTFLVPGAYTIKLKVVDTLGQQSIKKFLPATVPASFVYTAISGTVFDKLSVPLGAAQVQVKKDGTLVKSTMTAANGTYSLTIKPGTYTITASKSGYTFGGPLTVTVPPAALAQNITATGP